MCPCMCPCIYVSMYVSMYVFTLYTFVNRFCVCDWTVYFYGHGFVSSLGNYVTVLTYGT